MWRIRVDLRSAFAPVWASLTVAFLGHLRLFLLMMVRMWRLFCFRGTQRLEPKINLPIMLRLWEVMVCRRGLLTGNSRILLALWLPYQKL